MRHSVRVDGKWHDVDLPEVIEHDARQDAWMATAVIFVIGAFAFLKLDELIARAHSPWLDGPWTLVIYAASFWLFGACWLKHRIEFLLLERAARQIAAQHQGSRSPPA